MTNMTKTGKSFGDWTRRKRCSERDAESCENKSSSSIVMDILYVIANASNYIVQIIPIHLISSLHYFAVRNSNQWVDSIMVYTVLRVSLYLKRPQIIQTDKYGTSLTGTPTSWAIREDR